MKASLLIFESELDDLQHYIQELELESKLLSSHINETAPMIHELFLLQLQDHMSFSTIIKRRVFNYNCIIVTLYGYLEQFIESMLKAYVNHLNKIVPKYMELPSRITKHQIELSFRLLNRIDQTRYRGAITPELLISNLYSCVTNSDKYQVNAEAFTHHRANFRIDTIQESFSRVGISNISEKIKMNTKFSTYLIEQFPGRKIANIRSKEIFFYLNDLAERRNDVAHGTPSEDILNNKYLSEYINFFSIFGLALYDIVRNEAIQFELTYQGIELGSPICVLEKGEVVCIASINSKLRIGDLLIAKTKDKNNPYLMGEILELQIQNNKVLEAGPGCDVGIQVPFKAKRNHSFFVIPKHIVKD